MKVTFTPYRGKVEPITNVYKAELTFFEEYVEIVYAYDFEKLIDGERTPDTSHAAFLLPRYDLTVVRSSMYHQEDEDKEFCPYVEVSAPTHLEPIYLRCKTNKEADTIYSSFREYLVGVEE
jgi:hypothetical protein